MADDTILPIKKAPVTGGSAVTPSQSATGSPVVAEKAVMDEFHKKMEVIRLAELEGLAKQQADTAHIPYIDLVGFPVSDTALQSIPREIAAKELTICFFNNEKSRAY